MKTLILSVLSNTDVKYWKLSYIKYYLVTSFATELYFVTQEGILQVTQAVQKRTLYAGAKSNLT